MLRTPFEMLRRGEERAGLPPMSLAWSGPFDPAADHDWRLQQAGRISEREYWQRRAEEFAELSGRPVGVLELMGVLFDQSEEHLVRPQARQLIDHAKAAGISVAVLTNDLLAFHGSEWVSRLTVLRDLDLLIDGSVEGMLKPDPAIYRLAVDRLHVDVSEVLFVDDQPVNVLGAEAVGMRSIHMDVTDPNPAFRRARRILGLS